MQFIVRREKLSKYDISGSGSSSRPPRMDGGEECSQRVPRGEADEKQSAGGSRAGIKKSTWQRSRESCASI